MALILTVDDNYINRELIVSLLSHFGHRVLEAKDGIQGLEVVRTEKPDLIIADVLMPTMNGFEYVTKPRQDPDTSRIPVIFYSGTFLTDEMNELACACGVPWVLSKPATPEETLRIVNKALAAPHVPAAPAANDEAQIKVVQILNNKLFDRNTLLDELNTQLERRLEEHTSELMVANEHLREQMLHREDAERQLRQAQRLDAIGRLAGGVAHDFNNILAVILGKSEILLDRCCGDAIVRDLQMIKESAQRGAALTRHLLAFGRRQTLEPRVLDLNKVISDLERLLKSVIGEDIELRIQPAAGLANIKVDPSQIEQVIMNLAVNARDAMPGGGRIEVATANVELDEAYINRRPVVRPGSYVQLVVSDTGCGMDEHTQSRIFEPFFTTKQSGNGTGLGLATVYGIVKQSGGNVWVYSEPGRGTAFKVYLPVAAAVVTKPHSVEPMRASASASETILVVEDDNSIREVTCEFLRDAGYKVFAAGTPQEALGIANQNPGEIDLLVTDVVMPRMNGRELAIELTSKWPGLKVLYISGYTGSMIKDGVHGVLSEGLEFLQKPFTRHALTQKIRQILDACQSEPVPTLMGPI